MSDRFQRMAARIVAATVSLCFIFTLAGCGPTAEETAEQQSPIVMGLNNLGEAYCLSSVSLGRPPKNFEELQAAEAAMPGGLFGVDETNVVILYGSALTDLGEEPGKVPSEEILAYEKQVPETGGYVLMLDRTVRKMTPDEFKAAKKAS